MAKINMDVCDSCGNVIEDFKGGLEISGENIKVLWAGKSPPSEDVFQNDGVHAPMNGRISITICTSCIRGLLVTDPFR